MQTRLVALRGLAGTGKSTLIPTLMERIRDMELEVAVGTPTHRAAVLLRGKGILDADTIHALSFIPLFTLEYEAALQWLVNQDRVEPIPELLLNAVPDPLAFHAWRQIVLIGDPGQLPPVKDTPVLERVEGIELMQIHRQALNSPIIRLAHNIRRGSREWLGPMRLFVPNPRESKMRCYPVRIGSQNRITTCQKII